MGFVKSKVDEEAQAKITLQAKERILKKLCKEYFGNLDKDVIIKTLKEKFPENFI